jgi:hypothetical protein
MRRSLWPSRIQEGYGVGVGVFVICLRQYVVV